MARKLNRDGLYGPTKNLLGLIEACSEPVSHACASRYPGIAPNTPLIKNETRKNISEEFFRQANFATRHNHYWAVANVIAGALGSKELSSFPATVSNSWAIAVVATVCAIEAINFVQRRRVNAQTDSRGEILSDASCLTEALFEKARTRLIEWAKYNTREGPAPAE